VNRIVTDSTALVNRIVTDSTVLADKMHADSLTLATRMDTVYKHLCDSVMACDGIQTMQTDITNNTTNITTLQNKLQSDSAALADKIHSDSLALVNRIVTDSTALADKMHTDSLDLVNRIVTDSTALVNRIVTDSTVLADKMHADSLTLATRMDTVYKHLCDSVMACDGIQTMQTDITNNTTNITTLQNKLQSDSAALADKIHSDSLALVNRIVTDSTALADKMHTDSLTLATRMDTVYKHLCDSVMNCDGIETMRDSIQKVNNRLTNDSTILADRIHTDSIALVNRIVTDSTALAHRMDTLLKHVCDSVETCVKGWISDSTRMVFDTLHTHYTSLQTLKDSTTAIRGALVDSARNIRNSVGNGTLSITYGTNDPVTFKANQNTNSSIAIPAPNDGTLTINYGNHTEGTFSANQSGSTVVNIPQYNGGCDSVTFCQLLQMVIDLTNRVNQLEAANCPTLGAVTVSNVTISSATLTATIGNYDPLTVQEFGFLVSASEIIAYDEAIKYRVTSQTPGVFTMDLIGLQPETTYYVRAYALNDAVRCTQSTMLGAQTPWQTNPSVCPTLTKAVVGTTTVEDSVSLSATMSVFPGEARDLGFLWTTNPDWTSDVDTVHITPVPSSFTESYLLTQGKAGLAYNIPYYFKAYVKPDSMVCSDDVVFGDTAKFMFKNEDFKITVDRDSVCAGDTVTLTAPEGTAYEWSTNETTRSIKVIQSKKETKTYTVTVTTTSGQKTIGTTVSTLMEPMVIYADSVADHTLEFYLSENITGADYVWNKNGEIISGATTYSYTDNNVNITEAMGSADYYGVTVSLGNCTIKDSVQVKWVANAVRYCGGATVEDHQGNVYNTVFIGHLCWTRENMRATQYYNGETYVDIANGTQDSVSSSYSAYCYYPANGEPNAVNGYLYNWHAATGNGSVAMYNDNVYTRGVCPEGWHLPSFQDASYLVNVDHWWTPETTTSGYNPGMLAGTGWKPCCENTVAAGNYSYEYRNITGFSSVPAGRWDFMEDENLGYNTGTTSFWTCLHNGGDPGAFCFFIQNDEDRIEDATIVEGMLYHKGTGMSVRCVLDSLEGHTYPPTVSAVTLSPTGATVNMTANVISSGGANVTERGVCWSTSQNPTIEGSECDHSAASAGIGEFTVAGSLTPGTTYYVRAYAINSAGTAYGEEVTYFMPNLPKFPPVVSTASQFLALKEGFEGSTLPSTWTTIDNDGDGKNWYRLSYLPHGDGEACAASASFDWDDGPVTPDNYLITPDITLPSGISPILSFWYRGLDSEPYYAKEHFEVKVGDAGASTVGDFNTQLFERTSSNGYVNENFDLSSYAGQTIRLAFVHNNVTDKSHLLIDDIEVGVAGAGATAVVSDINANSAHCNGYVADDGGATVTARGVCWSTSQNPTISNSHTTDGTGTGSFTSNLTGLSANTTYYVRAYATNSEGTTYGNQLSFTTTKAPLPEVTTSAVSDITIANTTINATCGGNVIDEGASAVTACGVCWSTSSSNPPSIADSHTTDGSGLGSFTSTITGLTANTTYYVRAYATNSAGTAYGNQESFTVPLIDEKSCPDAPTVTDHEGNVYATVLIGAQCWMRENLRTTTSPKTGTYLVNTENKTGVARSSYMGSKVAHWYMNDPTTYAPKGYGLLYNWCAAMDTANPTNYVEVPTSSTSGNNNAFSFPVTSNHRGICPVGWHIPFFADLNALKSNYTNSDLLAGGDVWSGSPSNASGFTALPASYFGDGYQSFQSEDKTYFWSCFNVVEEAQSLYLTYNQKKTGNVKKNFGMSVRCVRD